MPALLRNDSAQTVDAANRANESAQNFLTKCRNFAQLAAGGTGLEGAAQTAFAAAGDRVNSSGTNFHSATSPRIDAIHKSAAESLAVGDEGASALGAVDTAI